MYAIGQSAAKGFGSYPEGGTEATRGIDELWFPSPVTDYHQGLGVVPVTLAAPVISAVGGVFNPKATQSNVVERFTMAQAGQKVRGSTVQGDALAKLLIDQVYQHAYVEGLTSWQAEWQGLLNVASPGNLDYMRRKMGQPAQGAGSGGVTGSPHQPGSTGLNISQAGIGSLLFSPLGIGLGLAVLLLSRKR